MPIRALLVCLAAALAPAAARADLQITVGSVDLAPGQSGTVDVWVTGGSEPLDFFVARFRLESATGGPPVGVRFAAAQPVGYANEIGYVLFNNTAGPVFDFAGPQPADTLQVADASLDGLGGDVSAPRLLARLRLEADLAAPGASYRLLLDPTGSQFQDPGLNELAFTSTAGTVAVYNVPEPGAAALLAGGLPALAALVRRFRRQATGA